MLGWGVPTLDSHYVFTFLYQTARCGEEGAASWNFTSYSNAKIDELTDAMLKRGRPGQARQDDRRRLGSRGRADMPYLPLHHQLIVWSMSDKVTIPIFANDLPNFKYSTMK